MNEVEVVYEQALKTASHSVHLWVSYCNFGVSSFEDPADVRRLFERGLSYVDKDYLCHLLWDKYIEFEYCQKQWDRLAHIYINTLRFPTRKLQSYYESFKKLVALLEEQMGSQNATTTPPKVVPDCEMTHVKGCESKIPNAVDLVDQNLAGSESLKKYLFIGELLYHKSSQLDKIISSFEAQIQRQYFHIKPLDVFQLENWHEYLTFVEEQENFDWTVKLYERCLIPCANYSEFWIRYVDFVDAKGGREIANDALERALKVFLKRIPAFHLYYSMFKEKIGDAVNARAPFLKSSEGCTIDVVESVSRKANMEKRMGNIEAALEIYDKAIKMAHEKQNFMILPLLYINFARFTFVVTRRVDAANEVFFRCIQQNPCKLIIEGFLDFITMHGGMNHIDSVDCKMAALLSPESYVSQALSSHDREEISQLYLKFVDLYGTIDETRLAWERHRKLFPHIMRPSSTCDYSSNEFQIQSKKTEGPKGMQTNSHNHSSENPNKSVLVKHLVKNHFPISIPIILPEETKKCELKSYGKADNDNESQNSIAAESIHIHEPSFPAGSEIDVIIKVVNDTHNVAQIPDASSEYHETEKPIQSYVHTISHGNLEPPALDNLSISSTDYVTRQTDTGTFHDNNAPQEATSKVDGNKFEGNGEVSVLHLSGEKNLKSDSDSLAKLQEDSSHSHPANQSTGPIINADAQLKFQEKVDTNQALPVNAELPQTASGRGQWAQFCHGVQGIADPNSMLCGNIQPSNPQQRLAHGQMHNQPGGTSQETYLTQSYISPAPSLPYSQVPQASHTQLQYQLAVSQAHTNPGPPPGQHMQQPGHYAPDQQVQHASSQTQIQYQNVSQSDEQYGYYQSLQGLPPHIWQYYQNLYYLQQQQLQGQQMNNSHKQQLADPSEVRNSQQQLLENQDARVQLQVQTDTPQHHGNLDEKLNATMKQQIQQEKQEKSTQPNQQSTQVLNSEQSQIFYLQQQQHFYLQQHQHYQMYLQQQHLLQQQQQQQQLLLFQQQQLLQFQHQPKQPQQQQQSPYPQEQHQSSFPQQEYQPQQQTNALELKVVEGNAYSQGEGDPPQSVGQLTKSYSPGSL